MNRPSSRVVPGDWYAGTIPDNVHLADGAYIETAHSFLRFRSRRATGATFGARSSLYKTSMLDVGPDGVVHVGRFALVQGARIQCDLEVVIGDFSLISWKVLIMDAYRWPTSVAARRGVLSGAPMVSEAPRPAGETAAVRIGRGAWIGFEACVLPGVTVGDGAVIGARSVVAADVPAFAVVAGNPARVVRELPTAQIDAFRALVDAR